MPEAVVQLTMEERLATLEQQMRDARADIARMEGKLDAIQSTLDQMAGGKKVVLGLYAAFGGLIVAAGNWLSSHVKWH